MEPWEREIAGYEEEARRDATKRQTYPGIGDAVLLAGTIERVGPVDGNFLVRIGTETVWVERRRIVPSPDTTA